MPQRHGGRAVREHPLEEVYLQQGLEGSEMENVLGGLEQPYRQSYAGQTWRTEAGERSGSGEREKAKPKRPLKGEWGK